MLKPEHLLTLREVVQTGSFAKAANRLGYTASAVSQQMAALEKELGVALFERSARAIVPTHAAQVVARHGEPVLTEIERLMHAAGATRDRSTPTLRLGLFPSAAEVALPELLARLGDEERRGLRISIAEPSQLVPSLGAAGGLDAAIVYQVGQAGLSWPSSLKRRWIAEDPYVIAYPRAWGNTPTAPFEAADFAELPWILNHSGSGDESVIAALFARWDLYPHVVSRCDDYNATIRMVAAGFAAAPLPRLALADIPDEVELLPAPWLNLSRSITGLVRADFSNPYLPGLFERFAQIVTEFDSAYPGRG